MTDHANIHYACEPALAVAEFRRVLIESGLGASRPVGDEARLTAMLSNAGLVLTVRLDRPTGPLVGVARCVTDFTWCCYLSELAVCPSAQGLSIGKGLLAEARRQLGPGVSIILISAPEAVGSYEKTGTERIPRLFGFVERYNLLAPRGTAHGATNHRVDGKRLGGLGGSRRKFERPLLGKRSQPTNDHIGWEPDRPVTDHDALNQAFCSRPGLAESGLAAFG
jgi:hypothetical protein